MNCHEVMDRAYEFEGNTALPFLTHLRIQLHLLHCGHCAGEIERLERTRLLMTGSFFPTAPKGLEERIMRSISLEDQMEEFSEAAFMENGAGVSFRSWVVTGLIILISLSTSFLGMDFSKVADHWGSSFLLPIGITIGAVISAYGALFIGSHLKELSDRFNLH
ncbi:hypothetical protein AGMMS49944_17040 [Spirochaetia bacterium]|nr:hypothetical protein AGMMS49944_17040 [Spirochaetia bacterium]